MGLDDLVESALLHVLHDDVEVEGVAEESVELDYVGMGEEETDLQLLHELI